MIRASSVLGFSASLFAGERYRPHPCPLSGKPRSGLAQTSHSGKSRMTPNETAAFHAGIKHAAEMALIAALHIELRPDADQVRQRAAIEALRGLAEGLKGALHERGDGSSSENAPASADSKP